MKKLLLLLLVASIGLTSCFSGRKYAVVQTSEGELLTVALSNPIDKIVNIGDSVIIEKQIRTSGFVTNNFFGIYTSKVGLPTPENLVVKVITFKLAIILSKE